jgi:HEAT repeat protein
MALLNHEDPYTRLDAVRTLASCPLEDSQQALRRALLDHSPLVVQAAEEALARFARSAQEHAAEESTVGVEHTMMSPVGAGELP